MEEKMKEKTMRKKKEGQLPLKVTWFFCCSLVSNLPRKEHTLHYRAVFLRYFIMKRWRFEEKLQLDKHSQRVEGAGD